VIYVYAIGEHAGCLTAFVKRDMARAPVAEPGELLDHDRVVYSLMERGAVLPMRFGTVFGDETDIRSLLMKHRKELRDQLSHVRGRVEFGVRMDPVAVPVSGRDYMHAKLEASRTLAPLAELAVDTRVRPKDTAYLVDRELAAAFEERARGMKLSLTGPWPPYSFTGALDG
jgi:gas vesicle protein GvpL/GvpF